MALYHTGISPISIVINNWLLAASYSIKQSGQKPESGVILKACFNIVWENYLDVFAPNQSQPLSLQVVANYSRGHDLPSCHVSDKRVAFHSERASLSILMRGSTLYHTCLCALVPSATILHLLSTPFITPIT